MTTLRMKNLDIVNLQAKFSKDEIATVNRDFKVFGLLFNNETLSALNTKRSDLDGKILNISPKFKGMTVFIESFNEGVLSNNPDYLLDNNSEFHLIKYRGRNFIIILDKINNLVTNKRCFNMSGVLFTKVKDTLSTEGELHREGELNKEGEEYKAIFKDTILTHLERNN